MKKLGGGAGGTRGAETEVGDTDALSRSDGELQREEAGEGTGVGKVTEMSGTTGVQTMKAVSANKGVDGAEMSRARDEWVAG